MLLLLHLGRVLLLLLRQHILRGSRTNRTLQVQVGLAQRAGTASLLLLLLRWHATSSLLLGRRVSSLTG